MDLCLVMIGRFEERNGDYYGDKKNINAIERYLRYFDTIYVVARQTDSNSSIYPRQKIDCKNGRISFSLYKEMKGLKDFSRYLSDFKNKLSSSVIKCDMVLCWAETKTKLILKLAKKHKKPVMVYVGGCNRDILFSSKSLIRKMAGIWVYYDNKCAIKNADYVHYVTNSVLQKRYPTNGKYIGASYVKINTAISEKYLENRIGRYDKLEKFTLGIIGYLNEVKGIDTAIYALSHLDSRFCLRILGGGDPSYYKSMARKLGIEERVIFEGTILPGEPVLNWLDKIDLYLQPSRTEGLPRATIEAMSTGCPIISTNVMGLKELTEREWIHRPGDWKELARLIIDLSSNPDELKKQSKRSFQVAKRYNRDLLDERIDSFFKGIIQKVEKK
ncbi:glycosyltransferase family 4 protein [Lederbergia wuyishanensis]|uniref:Glycosyltransferase involved in cell wall biosynthesis n=1 Tax=Lederbergia wuyishanensis TaxID=1347903 RepID=A0ABU0D391_9BACI|nr:glycosyltransferase family 4 protein [Lederbergia wuyishanensis]MCJ8007991.1 glycosyltransferase family 4 protein [Lederbergia wuyishanensis]MDQ0342838.1 glycosyltransferase involved in cell wall biosynthesis [Lederbergia wuyishanensis]